jgi:hypothetical protein
MIKPIKPQRIILNRWNYGVIRQTVLLDPQEGVIRYLDIMNIFNGKVLRRTTFKNGKPVSSMPSPKIDDEIE